jgi:hypothetical protein
MQAMAIRVAIMAAALLIAAVCFLATGVFLCIALYNGLLLVLQTPWLAALAAAGIILILAILVIAIGSAIAGAAARRAERRRDARGPELSRVGVEVGRIVGETAYRYVSQNPTRVLIGALVAGFAFGAVPKLRSVLMSFLRKR